MIRFGLLAGAGLILVGQVGTAEAQVRYRHGYYAGGWGHSAQYGGYYRGSRRGPAFAAALVGGALLGGILRAATAPAYRDPYTYSYGYNYASPYDVGYYPAPVYQTRYVYGPPTYAIDPYAAPHEIRGGYRTVYSNGRRVIVGGPAY